MWGTAGLMTGLSMWSFRRYNYQSRLIAAPMIFYAGQTFCSIDQKLEKVITVKIYSSTPAPVFLTLRDENQTRSEPNSDQNSEHWSQTLYSPRWHSDHGLSFWGGKTHWVWGVLRVWGGRGGSSNCLLRRTPRRSGQRPGQCRPKVRGRFASPSAGNFTLKLEKSNLQCGKYHSF